MRTRSDEKASSKQLASRAALVIQHQELRKEEFKLATDLFSMTVPSLISYLYLVPGSYLYKMYQQYGITLAQNYHKATAEKFNANAGYTAETMRGFNTFIVNLKKVVILPVYKVFNKHTHSDCPYEILSTTIQIIEQKAHLLAAKAIKQIKEDMILILGGLAAGLLDMPELAPYISREIIGTSMGALVNKTTLATPAALDYQINIEKLMKLPIKTIGTWLITAAKKFNENRMLVENADLNSAISIMAGMHAMLTLDKWNFAILIGSGMIGRLVIDSGMSRLSHLFYEKIPLHIDLSETSVRHDITRLTAINKRLQKRQDYIKWTRYLLGALALSAILYFSAQGQEALPALITFALATLIGIMKELISKSMHYYQDCRFDQQFNLFEQHFSEATQNFGALATYKTDNSLEKSGIVFSAYPYGSLESKEVIQSVKEALLQYKVTLRASNITDHTLVVSAKHSFTLQNATEIHQAIAQDLVKKQHAKKIKEQKIELEKKRAEETRKHGSISNETIHKKTKKQRSAPAHDDPHERKNDEKREETVQKDIHEFNGISYDLSDPHCPLKRIRNLYSKNEIFVSFNCKKNEFETPELFDKATSFFSYPKMARRTLGEQGIAFLRKKKKEDPSSEPAIARAKFLGPGETGNLRIFAHPVTNKKGEILYNFNKVDSDSHKNAERRDKHGHGVYTHYTSRCDF